MSTLYLTYKAPSFVTTTNLRVRMLFMPMCFICRVPVGSGQEDNALMKTWGDEYKKVEKKEGEYRWHDDIARRLHGMDSTAAAKLAGARFSVLLRDIAKLERAIGMYFMDFHEAKGYTEVSVPHMVLRSCLEGTGQLPKFEEDLFKVGHSVGEQEGINLL